MIVSAYNVETDTNATWSLQISNDESGTQNILYPLFHALLVSFVLVCLDSISMNSVHIQLIQLGLSIQNRTLWIMNAHGNKG